MPHHQTPPLAHRLGHHIRWSPGRRRIGAKGHWFVWATSLLAGYLKRVAVRTTRRFNLGLCERQGGPDICPDDRPRFAVMGADALSCSTCRTSEVRSGRFGEPRRIARQRLRPSGPTHQAVAATSGPVRRRNLSGPPTDPPRRRQARAGAPQDRGGRSSQRVDPTPTPPGGSRSRSALVLRGCDGWLNFESRGLPGFHIWKPIHSRRLGRHLLKA